MNVHRTMPTAVRGGDASECTDEVPVTRDVTTVVRVSGADPSDAVACGATKSIHGTTATFSAATNRQRRHAGREGREDGTRFLRP